MKILDNWEFHLDLSKMTREELIKCKDWLLGQYCKTFPYETTIAIVNEIRRILQN